MKHTLENKYLQVSIQHKGAEISSIVSKKTGQEYIWQADRTIWGSSAPVLFPIIGALKENQYTYKGETYTLPKHGFIRNNMSLEVIEKTDTLVCLSYQSSEETLRSYPFEFEFRITYQLEDNSLKVYHTVRNKGNDTMLFSLGGHPAFNCPLNYGEHYSDYFIEFDQKETDVTHELGLTGLTNGGTHPLIFNSKQLNLTPHIFDNDALIFKHLKSRAVTLKNVKSKQEIRVEFDDFNYLGIWAKSNAPFVCIEPWLGITDAENGTGKFEDKEGLLSLEATKTFKAMYSIEISE
ncbi:MAG: aldose 1-epimerase family protein [Flavobacteriaceae bacterium]|nr:aldose 1-epimerase family protein [Flavobacteriaceae bacterium]